ncbi:MAG: hypothetical protein EA365_07215 [Gloeocapsa sp. DLM2.Bin57]|nr:MAG: hypothetical protein EA365_07215 [Gloeocapsa sp. DLM2.Bin57]
MSIIYWLDEIDAATYPQVGQKAYTLSQIKQRGYPVTPGLVISNSLFEQFLTLSPLDRLLTDFASLDCHNHQALQTFAQQSRQIILNTTFPPDWLETIYREVTKLPNTPIKLIPSVCVFNAMEWDELLSSQFSLNHPEGLSQGIKNSWAELFRAKILWLLQKRRLNLTQVKFALLLQPYYTAISSGVTTIDPSTVIIDSTWGDKLALDWGEVLPDRFCYNSLSRVLATHKLGNKLVAYRLNNDLLARYLLDEEAQTNYSLTEQQLTELENLCFDLVNDYPSVNSFTWSWRDNQLDITEVKPYLTPLQSNSNLIIQGLAASQGQAIAPAQIILDSQQHWQSIPPQQILVFANLTPDWLPLVKKAAGIITETGGLTSHGAIIARELGIPAIVGAEGATQLITTGTLIKINGDTGEVSFPSGFESQSELELDIPLPYYPISTQLFVNISQLESLNLVSGKQVDGVGLLRTEFFFLELLQQRSLITWLNNYSTELKEHLQHFLETVCQAFPGKPVFYRSLNWESLELNKYLGEVKHNQKIKEIFFKLELEIILELSRYKKSKINLLLPFIRSVEEFQHYYQLIEKSGLLQQTSLAIWIMAEVPSVIFLLPEYVAAGVQGISIGTNDLSKFLLGINREDTLINSQLTTQHPAVKKAIKQLITSAQELKIPCSICGQISVEYPEIITDLVRWGIQSISVEAKAITKTYGAIARAEQGIILDMARKFNLG